MLFSQHATGRTTSQYPECRIFLQGKDIDPLNTRTVLPHPDERVAVNYLPTYQLTHITGGCWMTIEREDSRFPSSVELTRPIWLMAKGQQQRFPSFLRDRLTPSTIISAPSNSFGEAYKRPRPTQSSAHPARSPVLQVLTMPKVSVHMLDPSRAVCVPEPCHILISVRKPPRPALYRWQCVTLKISTGGRTSTPLAPFR